MKKQFTLILIFLFLFISCETTAEAGDTVPPPLALSYDDLLLTIPSSDSAQTTDAILASVQVALANAPLALFQSYGSLSGSAEYSDGTWTWSITNSTITISVTASKLEDGSVKWKYTLDDSSSSPIFTNWVLMEATISADAKSGSFNIYESNSTDLLMSATFETSTDGTYTSTTNLYSSGSVDNILEITVNADGSGDFVKTSATGVKEITITWDADGNVTYATHTQVVIVAA